MDNINIYMNIFLYYVDIIFYYMDFENIYNGYLSLLVLEKSNNLKYRYYCFHKKIN